MLGTEKGELLLAVAEREQRREKVSSISLIRMAICICMHVYVHTPSPPHPSSLIWDIHTYIHPGSSTAYLTHRSGWSLHEASHGMDTTSLLHISPISFYCGSFPEERKGAHDDRPLRSGL